MRYLFVCASLLISSVAAAQMGPPPGAEAPPVAPPSPGFFFMDKVHSNSMMSADLAYTVFEGEADATALRFDLHGQMVLPGGVGGYLTLPLLYGSIMDESSTDIGNLELGGLLVLRNPGMNIIGRAGLALPTARSDEDGLIGINVAQFLNYFSDLSNIALIVPELTTLRLGGTIEGWSGQFFYRADLGIDVFIDSQGDDTPDPIARLNLAAGVDLGTAAIAAEWINIMSTEDGLDDDESFIHALGVSARFKSGPISPGIALGFPLDDTFQDFVDFYILAGVDVALAGFGI